jgi:hypothetical protein
MRLHPQSARQRYHAAGWSAPNHAWKVHLMRTAVTTIAVLLASLATAAAQANSELRPAQYSLKNTDVYYATPFSRKVATGSVIPFDKTYAEMTAEQKRFLRSQYENMADADEPPFPEAGLERIFRAVARGQQKRLARGELSIIVDIDASGMATKASVYSTPDTDLANYTAGVLLKQRYKPALCGGQTCAMQFPFRVTLTVD